MGKFQSGSAYATARDIGEGFFAVTDRWFRGMSASEMSQLALEIDRHLRELRGAAVATDDTATIQGRNRRIQRLSAAMSVLNLARQRLRG